MLVFYLTVCLVATSATIGASSSPKASWSDPVSACIWLHNVEVVNDVTLEECQEKCDSTTTFACRSVEWSDSGLFAETCWMSNVTSVDTQHFQRPCPGLFANVLFSEKKVGGNGEEVCQGHGYDETTCTAIGCCHYDDGQCWSSVGQEPCGTSVGGNGEEVCEGHGYDETTCTAIGCCHYDDEQCWSSVGQESCGTSGNGEEVCQGHGYDETTCTAIGCCHFDDGQCWSSVGQAPCWTSGTGETDWTCDFCTKASSELVSHSTSTSSLEYEIALLLANACPSHTDPSFCRTSLPTFWAKFGKLIWSAFWALICVDKGCSSNDGVPQFWYKTLSSGEASPPSCQSCRARINAHLDYFDTPTVLNKLKVRLPKFCDTQEDVEACNEFGEWLLPDATSFFIEEYQQNIDWIIEICEQELECNKDE